MKELNLRHVTTAMRVSAGSHALESLVKELDRSGSRRPVLVCGSWLKLYPEASKRVDDVLGGRLAARFDDVLEHSPVPSVLEAAELLVSQRADAVIALGGGSSIVTARAASILAAEDAPLGQLATQRAAGGRLVSPRLARPKLDQWIVPSTPTTSYAKAGAAVRDPDTGARFALFDPKVRAKGVFFDPVVAATAPAGVVRSSALNAFAMCVDGLQASGGDPLAEADLRHALGMLSADLGAIGDPMDGDLGVRLMFAALLAGRASDHVGTGMAQALSHALGARSSVGNGVVEAMLLPTAMRFNVDVTNEGLQAVSKALRPEWEPSADHAISAVTELLAAIAVPSRLRDVGIEESALDEVVAHALDDWSLTTIPRPIDAVQLRDLLKQAW